MLPSLWHHKFWNYPKEIVHGFSRKMFPMLFSITWPSFTVWLPLLLDIFGNVFSNYFFPVCNVISFEINLSFLIKQCSTWPKKSEQIFKYPENEKRFLGEIKSILSTFSCQSSMSQTWGSTFKNVKQKNVTSKKGTIFFITFGG